MKPFVFATLAALAMSSPFPSSAPAATAETAKLSSRAFIFDQLAPKPTGVGLRRDVANQPTPTLARFQSHITTLNPGLASHAPHQHPLEELILVREGAVEVTINDTTQRAGPGSALFYASNDFHAIRNVGDKPATYVVLNFATAATATAPQERAIDSAPAKSLRSQVFEWTKLAAQPTKNGERRPIFNSPTVTCANLSCHATTVKNAQEAAHGPHRHLDEEVVVVKEGVLEATFGGAAHRGGPGSVFFFASNDEHGLRNAGDAPVTNYVIRVITDLTPKPPAKKTK